MDEETTEILIELVKRQECLWNFSHPEYKNVKRKIKAWNCITEECGVPIEICKKKWKGLRDSYARGISRTKHDDVDETAQCWKYREKMSFLKDQLQRRKNIGPYTITEETYDSACESYALTLDSEDKTDIFEYSPAEPEFENSFLPSSSSRRAKVPKINAEDSFISTMKSVEDFLAKQGQRTQALCNHSPLNTEDEYFCRSLVEKLSKFPLLQKNEAKMKMMQCLCDMEAELDHT